jgi:hypothetical protein
MTVNSFIGQRNVLAGLLINSFSVLGFGSIVSLPIAVRFGRVAGPAIRTFPPLGVNIIASAKQRPEQGNLLAVLRVDRAGGVRGFASAGPTGRSMPFSARSARSRRFSSSSRRHFSESARAWLSACGSPFTDPLSFNEGKPCAPFAPR